MVENCIENNPLHKVSFGTNIFNFINLTRDWTKYKFDEEMQYTDLGIHESWVYPKRKHPILT